MTGRLGESAGGASLLVQMGPTPCWPSHLGRVTHLSGTQFPHLSNGANHTCSQRCWEVKVLETAGGRCSGNVLCYGWG